MKNKRLVPALLAAPLLMGLTFGGDGLIVWEYHDPAGLGGYDASGRPLDRLPNPLSLDSGFFQRLSASLPERVNVINTNPELIASDRQANLLLDEDGEVFVTFMHEAAGFRNSFGFFTYQDGAPPQTREEMAERIIFPNCSFAGSGGAMVFGDTVSLGSFPAGTRIGFFVAANGYDPAGFVKPWIDPDWVFYSLRDLNAEDELADRAHNVVLFDEQTGVKVIGFEDIRRDLASCDQDFNDVMFAVTSNPPTAFAEEDLTRLAEPTDRDEDGALDANDAFPEDPERAFRRYYPSKDRRGTLAFEDLWPRQGDYDLNDLVLAYQCEQVTDTGGRVKDLRFRCEIVGRGAAFRTGFGLHIPGLAPGEVASASLTGPEGTAVLEPEAGQDEAVFILWRNAVALTPAPPGVEFFNVDNAAAPEAGPRFELTVTLNVARSLDGEAPYNPFLFLQDVRGLEVHLPGHSPTTLADPGLLGAVDDATDLAAGRSYQTAQGLPFALNIPAEMAHPLERTPIIEAYPRFAAWVQSAGARDQEWYLEPALGRVFGQGAGDE